MPDHMAQPFELVGQVDAGVCVDGYCAVPRDLLSDSGNGTSDHRPNHSLDNSS